MNITKVSLLFLLLLLPAFVYLFLVNFGKNNFKKLPRYIPIEFPTEGDTIFHKIPSFILLNQDSNSFTSESLKGKIYVTNFFFVTCTSICPIMTSEMFRVQQAFENDSSVNLLSLTVNPENDTPSILNSYAVKNRVNSKVWNLLTGPKVYLYNLAKEGFKMNALEDTANVGEFIHSDKFLLIDKIGVIRGIYNGTEQKDVDRLITEIKILKKEYE